ncbi:MAG: family 20 glycosylhydrolase [Opitutales bacterium]
MSSPKLFPLPRQVAFLGGESSIPERSTFSVQDSSLSEVAQFYAKERALQPTEEQGWLRFELSNDLHGGEEAHRILVETDGILIQATSPAGAFRATRTLKTLLAEGVTTLPCLEIQDQPAFPHRGFMLDLSRCKVPTMESLFDLIDLLADLKYNELQLYVEHTFAFSGHEAVWRDASPLTPEEIKLLDQRCRERFIELVPNLNSFGHFERWLRHEPYKHLAECPEGFRREKPFMARDHGTTLKPNEESLAFIDSLYAEYLPNFSSRRFNVGMDEPWELGQGWSKSRIEARGKQAVYLEHLDGIRKLVEKHGREMLFWADVLLEEPENASHLPKTASPVIWGYEAEHPFDEQAQALASCGLSFYLAPGTATWRSFTGRLPNALSNVRSAVATGLAHDASGILLTNWGDFGNHQPWATFYPTLLQTAGLSWNPTSDPEAELVPLLDHFLFPNESETPGQALIELGHLDLSLGPKIVNASLPWVLAFADQPEKLPDQLRENYPANKLQAAQERLAQLRPGLATLADSSGKAGLVANELLLGLDLSAHAIAHGQNLLEADSPDNLPPAEQLPKRYENLWLKRARPGGLPESLDLLERALAKFRS